jgi:hypothetical protein
MTGPAGLLLIPVVLFGPALVAIAANLILGRRTAILAGFVTVAAVLVATMAAVRNADLDWETRLLTSAMAATISAFFMLVIHGIAFEERG